MTFRKLLTKLQEFVAEHPDHESLDRQVIVRSGVPDDDDDDVRIGTLQTADVDAGCTDEYVLTLDADQDDE